MSNLLPEDLPQRTMQDAILVSKEYVCELAWQAASFLKPSLAFPLTHNSLPLGTIGVREVGLEFDIQGQPPLSLENIPPGLAG